MKIVLLDSLLSPQIVVAVSQAENIADSAEVVLPIFGKFLTQEIWSLELVFLRLEPILHTDLK